jgi:alkanesulfonate monooxygenase SsuD/methylene tetrahydromethanopterin reductase-like flavin-dependent oxidoreductase (luciferase family)
MTDFSLFVFPYQRAGTPLLTRPYVDLAQTVEAHGFYELALPDARGQAPSTENTEGPYDPRKADRLVIFDPLMLAPIIGDATRRLRIGIHSAVLPLMHPFIWAGFFSTLDVITNGRVDAGMCIGGIPREFEALGVSINKRGRMADEALELIKRLWIEDNVNYSGSFFSVSGATVDPKPTQKPHPPIWWGGGLPSIPRAVRTCDYLLVARPTPSLLRDQIIPRIQEEGRASGRQISIAGLIWVEVIMDNRNIERDVLPAYRGFGTDVNAHLVGSPERVAQMLHDLRQAGLSHFMLDLNRHGVDPLDKTSHQLELFMRHVVPLLSVR